MKDYKKYWESDNMQNIVPIKGQECPEGFDIAEKLTEALCDIKYTKLIDYGCGYGRLSSIFDKDIYHGYDINKYAIAEAKKRHPGYTYTTIDNATIYDGDILLVYTVFLHLDDDTIKQIIGSTSTKYIILCEILGREWRRAGNPPVFNRELNEYDSIFNAYTRIKHTKLPYARYSNVTDKNTDISYIVYERNTYA